MGKREVIIYTCDGCGASATLLREEAVRGFKAIQIPVQQGDSGHKLLCTVCYGAVEWIVKFQGITVPPRAFKHANGRYTLRRPAR